MPRLWILQGWRLNLSKLRTAVPPRLALLGSLVLGSAAPANAQAAPTEAEPAAGMKEQDRDLPFSEAVRAGDFLILSGQIGLDPRTSALVPGGVGAETRQALQNLGDVLKRHGASFADVVKCTIFLADIADWADFNAVYSEFFGKPFPARSAIGGSDLAFGARVEVECMAYLPQAG